MFIRVVLGIILSIGMSLAIAADNALTAIKVLPLPDSRIRVDFVFSSPMTQMPASFITEKPDRLILDFLSSTNQLTQSQSKQAIKLAGLKDYHIVAMGHRLRAILNLSAAASYSGNMAGNVYTLLLNGKTNEVYQEKKEIFIAHQAINVNHTITNLDFKGTDKQGGRVILDVSDASIPVDVTQTGKDIVAIFYGTRLPEGMNKRYDVADFHSPSRFVTLTQEGKNVRLVLVNEGDYGHYAYQVNKQFMIDVFPLTEEEIKQTKLKKRVFVGKRLSLNFQDISIRSVLQVLAEFTGVNMVVSDSVTGNITLRLNDIPWDQALDIILTTHTLDKREVGNVMLIAPATEIAMREKQELESQQQVNNLAPLRSELIQINYAKASEIATLLKDKNNSLLSKRGNLSVDTRTNAIWIQDTGAQIEDIRALVKQLDIPVQQVLIEARIVDVTKDFSQDLGIRFGVSEPNHLSGTLNGANQLQQGVTPPNITPLANRLNLDLAAQPVGVSPASVGIALAKLGGDVLLDLELSAMESEGRGEVISSPRLITTNQQPAVIESGQEIPYQEATSSGATAVAFKKAVLSLKVTPQITPDRKIMLNLQINQDTPSAKLFNGVPSILTKAIQTNVLVNNGQTIVLGGIYQKNKNLAINRIPFFGNLPVLGNFFRNKSKSINNEELLIFITPRIISHALSITTIDGQGQTLSKRMIDK